MNLNIIEYYNNFNTKKIKLEFRCNNNIYHLSERLKKSITEDDYFLFTKIRSDGVVLYTNDPNINVPVYNRKYRSNKICKRIFYHINNINKLDDGKIKDYQIFNRLELDVICNYLVKNNIVHEIVRKHKDSWFGYGYNSNEKFSYNGEKYKKIINGYIESIHAPEQNKVFRWCEIYIRVYKGFVDLCKCNIKLKYGIYIYDD